MWMHVRADAEILAARMLLHVLGLGLERQMLPQKLRLCGQSPRMQQRTLELWPDLVRR